MVAALILIVGAGAAFALIDSANRAVTSNAARIRRNEPRPRAHRVRAHDRLRPAPADAGRHGAAQAQPDRRHAERRRLDDHAAQRHLHGHHGRLHVRRPEGRPRRRPRRRTPCPARRRRSRASPTPTSTATTSAASRTRSPGRRAGARARSRSRRRSSTRPAASARASHDFDAAADADQPPTLATIDWGAAYTLKLTTKSSAASVHWTADDGVSQGDATGGAHRRGASPGPSAPRSTRPTRGCATARTRSRRRRSTRAASRARRKLDHGLRQPPRARGA